MANGTVSETVVRVNGQPVFSGSKMGANIAIQNALTKASNEGRAEPDVQVTTRTVNFDLVDGDPKKVTETPVIL